MIHNLDEENPYAKRGTWLAVRGDLQAWRYKKGERCRTLIETVVENIEFIGVKFKDDQLLEDPEAESPLDAPPAN